MSLTAAAKIIGSLIGLLLGHWVAFHTSLSLFQVVVAGAFFIGTFPIWFELIAGKLSPESPDIAPSPGIRAFHSTADIFSFLLVPSIVILWLFHPFGYFEKWYLALGLALFNAAGIYRVIRYLRNRAEGGLPLTYSGFIWAPLTIVLFYQKLVISALLLLAFAVAMLLRKIRLKSL